MEEKFPFIVDGILADESFCEVSQFLLQTTWKFGWKSGSSLGETFCHWNKHIAGGGKSSTVSCDHELKENIEAQSVSKAWKLIKEKFLPSHSLIRCYANAHTYGLDGTIHRDNPPEVNMTTTILYCHPVWPLPWGGETLFYNEDFENIRASVIPKPNRAVIFPGSVPHAAKSPSRVCRELRLTLVFKSAESYETP